MPEYDVKTEAKGCVNELFYRNGPKPEALNREDAPYVLEVIERCLQDAYDAGRLTSSSLTSNTRGTDQ